MKVVVLSGGFSEEQHASRDSAKDVAGALEALGHIPYMVEYSADFAREIKKLSPDAVFHIVQGKYHGDGAVQAVLELIGVPYTGSRPAAAAIINDKTVCKRIWRAAGIHTPEFFEYSRKEFNAGSFDVFKMKAESAGITLPVVVKAPTQGGRFGMIFVKDENTFKEMESVFRYDETLLAERYVEGRFITQGIIEVGGEMAVLPPVEIVDDTESGFKNFFDEDLPSRDPGLTAAELDALNNTTLEAARLVGASCFARLDYHISGGELFLIEINAVPGLRRRCSDLLKCAEAAGYDYETLIAMMLAAARLG